MGLREKYKEREKEIKELLDVPLNEPIFILRAQDKFSVDAITQYKAIVHNQTIIGEESSEWTEELGSIRNDFINWQRDNRDKVKVPD
jgi:hypothetical protein